MKSETVVLVQSSWAKVLPISDTAADLFYARLFELDPALRALFPGDLKEQKRKLMAMLGTAVNGLGNLGALVPAVQALGKRHVGYGVKDAHYDTVGTALLWTLEQGLGPEFDHKLKAAWTEVYTVLAGTMKTAAAADAA
jgi:hemoglobin-like flavoprotein